MPTDSVPIELDQDFDPDHFRLARATCLRIEGACPPSRPIAWKLHDSGLLGYRTEYTWDQVSDEYRGAESDQPPILCGIAISKDPDRWQIEIDAVDVGGHVAIVAPLTVLCDPASWARVRSRPHLLIATGHPVGVAIVTRGRWPADRQLRLVLV